MEDNLDLRQYLERFINEAQSEDGITGKTARASVAALTVARLQVEALSRLLDELRDDGITEEAIEQAEVALSAETIKEAIRRV